MMEETPQDGNGWAVAERTAEFSNAPCDLVETDFGEVRLDHTGVLLPDGSKNVSTLIRKHRKYMEISLVWDGFQSLKSYFNLQPISQ